MDIYAEYRCKRWVGGLLTGFVRRNFDWVTVTLHNNPCLKSGPSDNSNGVTNWPHAQKDTKSSAAQRSAYRVCNAY